MPDLSQSFIEIASKFIGTPFLHMGRTSLGMDCLGLLLASYEPLLGKFPAKIPNYKAPISPHAHLGATPKFLDEALFQSQTRSKGSVLLFELKEHSFWHIGIAISANQMLHAHHKRGVVSQPLGSFWQDHLRAIYNITEK